MTIEVYSADKIQHTLGHLDCPACNEVRESMLSSLSADLPFNDAAQSWLRSRSVGGLPISARYIRENTEHSYQQYIRSLALFFGEMRLREIHLGHFATYQSLRSRGTEPFVRKRRPQDAAPRPLPVKPKKVNQELCVLKNILGRAGCWTKQMEEVYQPLLEDEDEEIPRSLTPDEQGTWLNTARLQPRWDIVYWYSILAFGTCMSTDELRGIRIGDVNLSQRILVVPRGKVKSRKRTIELVGADVLWALERLLERAEALGSMEPPHYVFPWRISVGEWNEMHTARMGLYDPAKPMSSSGIKKPWEEVRSRSGLKWFRMYDCRHTAITRLAESGVPIDVIMSRAGHVSDKMRQHYTHISRAAQRKWMEHSQSFHQISDMYQIGNLSASRSFSQMAAYRR